MARHKAVGKAGGIGGLATIILIVLIILLNPEALPVLLDEAEPASQPTNPTSARSSPRTSTHPRQEDGLEQLFRDRISDVMVTLTGPVDRILPDDNDGSRHQRFIVRTPSGRTVLIAHNIDLARRVPIEIGDTVTIRGEYEWSDRGGTMHWTHHDPKQWREGGWIEHRGIRYE